MTVRTVQSTVVTGEDGSYELTLLADGVYLVALHAADGTPPRATPEDGHLLLVLAPGRWQLHRAGTSPSRIEAGDEAALLGSVALDPWTATDLYTGTDE